MRPVALAAAELARELRVQKRRTGRGLRPTPWGQIAAEVRRAGLGAYRPGELADAAGALPLATHPAAPLGDREAGRLEVSFRRGWAEVFPADPWPGYERARAILLAELSQPRRPPRQAPPIMC